MLKFEKGGLYHIHNAGCGRQNVFFQKRNYHYFIRKIITYIEPYAEVLHYDLKPNEISLLIHVKHLELYIPERDRMRTLAESIGLMLRSYAQAINRQESRKGVLWQGPTKADFQGYHALPNASGNKAKTVLAPKEEKGHFTAQNDELSVSHRIKLDPRTTEALRVEHLLERLDRCIGDLYVLIYEEIYQRQVFRPSG
jgi:hypothetical protein